jgi:hypothetical protein
MKTLKKSGTIAFNKSNQKVVQLNSFTGNELFLYSLKEMGKPSLVRDMVKSIKKSKMVAMTKKKLLAKLYASASVLNRDGMIKRTPINGHTYMYSLVGWKFSKQPKVKLAA